MSRRANAETPLYKAALAYAEAIGCTAWRAQSGRRAGVSFGFTGQPDVIGYSRFDGRSLFIECKHESTDRRLTKEQFNFLTLASIAGCIVRVFTDVDTYTLDKVPERLLPRGAR